MEVMNPDYKYYYKLKGKWETDDGKYEVKFSEGSFELIIRDIASLKTTFSCVSLVDIMTSLSYMSDPASTKEEFRVMPTKAAVCDAENNALFKLHKFWYESDGTIHAKLTDLYKSTDFEPTFIKEEEVEKPLPEGYWKCDCGWVGEVCKFCPSCGKPRP